MDYNEINNCFIPTLEDIVFIPYESNSKDSYSLVNDEGIQYGLGFFETILIKNKPIFLSQHLDRLNQSLKTFNISTYITPDLIEVIIKKFVIHHLALKILVTTSNIIVSTRPLTYTKEYYEQGLNLRLSSITRSRYSFLAQHKSTNYGDMILSLREAHTQGYNDSLFFNEEGYLTETSIHNVFIIKDNQLITPTINSGLLPGIIRQYIIDTYPVIEKRVTLDDLVFADGIFLTNSLVGFIKVSKIDFNKEIIRKRRLLQVTDVISETVHYTSHPLYEKLTLEYQDFIIREDHK